MRLLACVVWVLAAGGACAQDLTGTWQGTVHPPDQKSDLRTVIKVSTSEAGAFKGTFYSLDQTPLPFPTTGTIQGSNIKITIPGIGCTFEGKLSPDGSTIAGSIKQGFPVAVAWTLKRVSPEQAWNIPKLPDAPKPMSNANPEFEVATIKLTKPGTREKGIHIQGQTISVMNMPVAEIMTIAFDLHVKQLLGAPSWFESDRFDITGKYQGDGQANGDQFKLMMRKLIDERFALKSHRDKKELPVYVITLAKGGSKLSKGDGKTDRPAFIMRGPGSLIATSSTVQDFAKLLQNNILDRPVLDQSGLTDRFDFSFEWTQATLQAPAPTPVAALGDKPELFPDLFTAAQQQLGLKIEPTRKTMDVMVIDKLEKPSEN